MSVQDWTNLVAALALLIFGFNAVMMERALHRTHDQVRRLTRRVWILEGRPRFVAEDVQ